MVSIERCSMSVFATKLLIETLLSFPGRTICVYPRLPRVEHLSKGRLGSLAAEPLECRNGRAAERRLRHPRGGHRPREPLGHPLDPSGTGERPTAGPPD